MSEFTGERLVPGEVDADLWNEHISRYAFAASYCSGRERVLDAGCGTGYGANFLSRTAQSVLGIDASHTAVEYASRKYGNKATQFVVGLCEALPARGGAWDLIVAFEVIEHLTDWRSFLAECRAALSPRGLLLVSTPNKLQYAESRGEAGPNPFHIHEFDFAEFSSELERIFPSVRIFGQNHVSSIAFSALGSISAQAQIASHHADPGQAGFFVAVCSHHPLATLTDFVYVPDSANILHAREQHIRLLRAEVAEAHAVHEALVSKHRAVVDELEQSNRWASNLNIQLESRAALVVELQEELDRSNRWARSLEATVGERDARVRELQEELTEEQSRARATVDRLEAELNDRAAWAHGLDADLAVARRLIDERTAEAAQAQSELARLRATYWNKIGSALRLVRFPQ